jgi:hypothetical protein
VAPKVISNKHFSRELMEPLMQGCTGPINLDRNFGFRSVHEAAVGRMIERRLGVAEMCAHDITSSPHPIKVRTGADVSATSRPR